MHKVLAIFKTSWENGLVYHLNNLLWQIRVFLSLFTPLVVWGAIYANQNQAFGYNREQMVSYIFLTAVMHSLILSSILMGLASTIYSGEFSNILVKPINVFVYLASVEASDKMKNFAFLGLHLIILYWMFSPQLVMPNLLTLLAFLLITGLGVLLNFLITLLFGTIGFWSPDSWGPRFLFMTVTSFAAGKLFPLDILPSLWQKIIFLTPFPYLAFVQTQIFLGKIPLSEFGKQFLVITAWLLVIGIVFKKIWTKGLKNYSAAGQ